MPLDYRLINGIKTTQDFQREDEQYGLDTELKKAQIQRLLEGGLGGDPSAVREWKYFQSLDDNARKEFLGMKRGEQVIDFGGKKGVRNPITGEITYFEVTPKPDNMPGFKGAQRAAVLEQDLKTSPEIEKRKAEAEVVGKDLGTTKANLGKIEQDAQLIMSTLGQLENHPGMSAVVGWPNPLQGGFGRIGNIPASRAADFQAKLDQLGGQQFLQAYNTLRGGGQITEVEGTKATNAIASMQSAQSEEQFIKSLNEFKGIVQQGLQRAQQKAGAVEQQEFPQQQGQQQPSTPAPAENPIEFKPDKVKIKDIEKLKQEYRLSTSPETQRTIKNFFDEKYGNGAADYFIGQ